MRRPRSFEIAALGFVAGLILAGRLPAGRTPSLPDLPVSPVAVGTPDVGALREEAVRLYASGQFPLACEHFSRAADHDPQRRLWRQDLARCFEGWGWQTLRTGRADEAVLLFRAGLKAAPDDPALLKGLGIATIHDGRPHEALAPLEALLHREVDVDVHLLLARLYDQRDEAEQAMRHLRAVLEREPEHPGARGLLDKVERERLVEAGFERLETAHFVVKSRRTRDGQAIRAVARTLEVARERVAAQLDYRPAGRLTVVVYDDTQFHRVTRVHGWVTGLFDGKIRLPLRFPSPPAAALDRLVTHEYAHAVIHDLSRGRAPRWLQEGLAQALEGAEADPVLRVPGHLTLSGLEALVTETDAVRARAGYDIALWVIDDLLRRGGMAAMRAMLERLSAGDTLAATLVAVYGVRLTELESQWRHRLGS